jgi:hypothetical protein
MGLDTSELPTQVHQLPDKVNAGGTYASSKKEVRVKNEKTGGEKGEKPQRYDLVPWDQMDKVAELYGRGAQKYAPRNWEKGYDWHLSFSSLMRHATQFWNGESYDEETHCHHLASVIFHALALMRFEESHPDLDDRPFHQSDD